MVSGRVGWHNIKILRMSKVIFIEKTDIHATLCTWIYCAMWQAWAAEQQGYDYYVNWPDNRIPGRCLRDLIDKEQFKKQPNSFEWYFKQPHGEKKYPVPVNVWTWERWKDPSPVPFMSQPLSVIKDYYKKNLIFSDVVNERGEALVKKYNIDFSNTIGITWRGTDIYLDGRFRTPIERYYKHIDNFIEENNSLRIACTAEEDGILEPLLKRYPQAFKIDEFYQAPLGSLHNPERFSPMSGFERGLQPALMVWLFSKCAYYIKNRSSTGAVASWLSDGFIINIGHPETLGYENQFDKDEIKGVWYDA